MSFADRLRSGERIVGYWSQLPVAAVQERAARHGYDYVCFDAQHGFIDQSAVLNGMIGIEAGAALAGKPVAGMVRTAANDAAEIGRALDFGALGVIVPLIDTPEDAARAVAACKFPPVGRRSCGPMRAGLRMGPDVREMDAQTCCIAMIETAEGLANVEAIAKVPGLDGLYIGPADLALSLGAARPGDPAVQEAFDAALDQVKAACKAAGIGCGIHVMDGESARARLAEGFTFASISSDLNHLDKAAAAHLSVAKG